MERIARLPAAAFLVAGGLVHLQLWRSGYRGIPYVGELFIANVVISAILALVLVVRSYTPVAIAGIGLALGSLVGLIMSRTVGLLGFTERAWTDQAVQALGAEIGAVVALAGILVATRMGVGALVPLPVSVNRFRRIR